MTKSTPAPSWWRFLREKLDDFLLGTALSWVMAPYAIRKGAELERIFALTASARLMGLPVLPPVYELKLLPYLTPSLLNWRRISAFSGALEHADLKHLGH
ncbi:MAG: hypothetical protein PVI99_02025 [Anaerolineales bacterium]|jgi:hypothetical protein